MESSNPQAIRSKKWIASALLELMTEKPFIKITIQEIADKAELDRRTFYRNFESKEDILAYHVRGISNEYADALIDETTLSISASLQLFCEIAYKHKDFISLLIQNNLSILLLSVFNEVLPKIHAKVKDKLSTPIASDETHIDYIFAYNAGGFWNILNKWFEDDNVIPPSQIAGVMSSLIGKIL